MTTKKTAMAETTPIEKEETKPVKNEPGSFMEQLTSLHALSNYIDSKVIEKVNMVPADPYESDHTDEINTALSKAQGVFPPIGFNKENPYFKNKYADLDAIVKAVKPMLKANNLSVTQQIVLTDAGSTILKTRLRHSSGQWIETRTRIVPTKSDVQSFGSFLTYMKRYSYTTLLNITTSDDNSDDDAERVMYDTRSTSAKGVALNTKYNPREQTSEVITKEQREELEYELGEYTDLADMVLDGLKIQSIADMPKSKFMVSIKRVREIVNAREGITKEPK